MNKQVLTKGDVVVNDIKIGDKHYEYEWGYCIESTVITLPIRDDDGYWSWKSETSAGRIITYGVNEKYSHYGPNIYTYPAYGNVDDEN